MTARRCQYVDPVSGERCRTIGLDVLCSAHRAGRERLAALRLSPAELEALSPEEQRSIVGSVEARRR